VAAENFSQPYIKSSNDRLFDATVQNRTGLTGGVSPWQTVFLRILSLVWRHNSARCKIFCESKATTKAGTCNTPSTLLKRRSGTCGSGLQKNSNRDETLWQHQPARALGPVVQVRLRNCYALLVGFSNLLDFTIRRRACHVTAL
jgi:hypothetical protein